MESKIILANILRHTARYSLLIVGLGLFAFSLLSGSEDYGGGIKGIVRNSPNSIPWLILLATVFIAWKWEFIGGVIISILGLSMLIYFNFTGPNFFLETFIMTFLIFVLGTFFILSWYLRK